MIELFINLLQLFLKISSIFIAIVTIFYIFGLAKFIYDAFDCLDEEAIRFGTILLIAFSIISIPANIMLFYIIW